MNCTYWLLCVLLVSRASAQSSSKTFTVASGTPPNSYIGTLDASNCQTPPIACQTQPCSTYLSTDLRFFYNSSGLLLWTSATLNVSRIPVYIVTFTCFPQFSGNLITLTGNITVVDTRVYPPQFSASWANLTVAEDAPLGSTYAFVSVTATSTSLSAVYVISGNLNDAFTILYQPPTDSNGKQVLNGTYVVSLVLSGVLQYAEVSSYQLVVVALDSSAQPLSANTSVQVNVQPANLNAPVFAQSVYFAKLNETAPIGQSVLAVSASDIDFGLNGRLFYSINSQFNAPLAALFNVDAQTGLVSLTGSLLSSAVPSTFEIVVNAQDLAPIHPLSASCVVVITVVRVSATRPVLSAIQWLVNTSTSSSTSISANALIPTGTATGTPIALLTIVRSDTLTAVSPITVTASPSSFSVSQLAPTSFQLLLASTISSVGTISIVVNAVSSLDVASVQFSLQATVVAASTPTFVSRLYNATVDETFVPGSYVVQVKLNWTAATSTQSVRFMLNNTWLQTSSGNVSLSSGSPFGVDAITGWVKLLSSLPCTAASTYSLLVMLTDAVGYTLDTTMVQVTAVTSAVTPADAPWFSAPFYNEAPTQSTFCLSDIVAYSSANCNSSLSYAAVNASGLPFNLSNASAAVCGSLASSPNYPIVADWYVKATDGAGRASTALVRLTVPSPSTSPSLAFANANLTIHIGALESTGTLISPLFAVYGTTQSQPTYSGLVYSVLSRNDPLLFALGRYNGWLTVAITPSTLLPTTIYPTRFSLQLTVNDVLNPNVANSSAVVSVFVHNETSDTTGWQRLFTQRSFFFTIHVDAALQQTIGTVTLTTTAFVTLQNNAFVACNMQTGMLTVTSSLVSAPSWLVLQLSATTSTARFDSAVVAIQLLPASTNPSLPQPTVISPSGNSIMLALRSDTAVGRTVYTALAFDPLFQTAASYSLSDSSGLFQLDSNVGRLSLTSPFPAGLSAVSLTISASVGLAQTSTVRTASLTLQLSILPCNAYSPTITSATYSQSGSLESVVSPVASSGTSLNVVFSAAYLQSSLGKAAVQFQFNDSDTVLRNQRSQFSLATTAYPAQSNVLDMDTRTGSLYIVNAFALAAVEQTLPLVLCVTNNVLSWFSVTGAGVSSSCAALQVTVINDAYWPSGPPLRAAATAASSAPVFTNAIYQLAVYENTAASSAQPVKIGRIAAFAPNTPFTSFTLLNYSTFFTVDSVGNFYVTTPLNRESSASYAVTVAATTLNSGASALALVNVTVLDVNENAPQFGSSSVAANLFADVPIGTYIGRANAVDADSGINALVRYSLPASVAGKFTIHPYSGVVRTCAPLAEPSGNAVSYVLLLTITATDSAFSPLASTALLNITVWRSAQANQSFAPVTNTNIRTVGPFNVSYSVSDGSFGAAFSAACPSTAVAQYAPSSGFIYYIVSDLSSSFYVDPDAGSLRLLTTPNAAVAVRYTVLVQAQSRDLTSFPRIFLNCVVLVNVVAASNPPSFDLAGYLQFTGAPSVTRAVTGIVGFSWIVPASGPLPSNQSQSLGVPTFVVPENAPVGYVVLQAYALSLDNLALTYSLGEVQPLAYSSGTVSAAVSQFAIDSQSGAVSLATALNFEAVAAYALTISCTDSLGRAATAAFAVNVANMPDTLPTFVAVSSNISTANWTLGVNYALAFTPFVRVPLAYVIATNPESSPLFYTVSSCQGFSESTCPVQVDVNTGLLSLWPALVPSGGISTLALTLATSGYYPPLYTATTQSLSIVFTNANDARLRAQFTATSYSLPVTGSQASLALVASAPVQNGVALSYAIPLTLSPSFTTLNGALLLYTYLDTVGGTLTVNVSTNNSMKGTYYVPVVVARGSSLNVSTGASTQLNAIDDAALVQVSVGSATPQPPTFAYTSYQFYVPEMMGYLSNMVTIPASVSSGPVGPVFYELFGLDWNVNTNANAPSLFVFANLLNGTLSSTRLNYQVAQQLTYSLVAFNGYVPTTSTTAVSSLQSVLPSSTVNITINVIDRNDCAPMFIVPGITTWQYTWTYAVSVPSNASVGTVLMHVQAHDNDTGLMGTVQFTLADASNLRFGIQPSDGTLYIAEPLDRLGALGPQLTYSLSVLAADLSPYNSLTSTATVQVTVVPVNNFAPQFVGQPYSSIILSDSPTSAGSVIGQLTVAAVDIDALVPANNVITLSVDNSSGPSILQFNTSSGQFYFSQNVSVNTFAICHFYIRATEVSYAPNLSTVTAVQLVITPSSQVSAVGSLSFSSAAYLASALESSPSGTVLLRVSAQSSNVQSAITYTLYGDSSSTFSLDPVNGTLVLLRSLNYALTASYTLFVSAQFTSDTLRQSNADAFAAITIYVNQTSSYAPVFLQSGYNASLLEGLPGGTAVVRVRAYSPIASQNANLTYSLRVGDTQQFQFDSSTPGLIRSVLQLNYQTASNYLLIAQVTDNQSPPRTATCSIAVRVIDTNSNSPTFPSVSFNALLSESTTIGTRVGAYSATDLDLDPPVTYSLVNASLRVGSSGAQYPAANFFSIAAFSAELFIVGSLTPLLADPPALSRTLSLGLVANNSPFSASTSILVTISTDYTLHPPACDSTVRHVSIAQSASDAQTVTISTESIGSSPAAAWAVSVASTPLLQLANITVLNQAYFSLIGSQALTYTLLTLTSNFSLSGNMLFVNWPAILAASSNIFIAVQVTFGQTGASCIEYLLINAQLTGSANVLTSTSNTAVSVSVATPPGTVRARSILSASYQLFTYQLALASGTALTYSSYTVAKTVVVNPLSGELLISGSAPAFYAPFYVSAVRVRPAAANLTISATPLSGGALTALGNGPLAVSAYVQQLELSAPSAPIFLGTALPCSGGIVPQLTVATGAANVATRLFAANQPTSFALATNGSLLLNSSLCSVNVSAATTYVLTQYDATWLANSLSNYQTVAVAAPRTVSLSLAYMQSFVSTATATGYPAAYTFYVSAAARNGMSIGVVPVALNVSYSPFITPTPVVAPTYTYYTLSNPQAQSACIDLQSARLTVCSAMPAAGTNMTVQVASFGPLSSQVAAVDTVNLRTLPGSSRAPTFSASNYSFGLPTLNSIVAGAVIGQIGAATTEQDPVSGLVYYSFQQSTPYFTINATSGVIQVTQALVDLVNGQTSNTTATNRRRRRQAATTPSAVTVTAQAGSLLTDANVTTVPVTVALAPAPSSPPSSSSSNTTIIIAVVVPVSILLIAAIIFVVLIRIKKLRLPKKQLAVTNEHRTASNDATTENGQMNAAYEARGFDPVVRSNLDQPYMSNPGYGTETAKVKAASIGSAEPTVGAVHTAAIVQQADAISRTTIASRSAGAPQPQLPNVDGTSRSSRAVSGPSAGGRVGSPPSASVSSSQPVSLPRVMPVFLAAQQQGKTKTASQPDSGILEAFATGSASSSQQRAAFRSGSASSSQQLTTPFDNASHLDDADEDDAVLARADLNDLSRSRDCYEYLQKLGIQTDLSAYANAPPAPNSLAASTSNSVPGRPTTTQNGPASRSGSHESASATTSENNSDREALRRAGRELLAGAGSGSAMIRDSEILLAPTPVPFLFEPDMLANLNLAAPNHTQSGPDRGPQTDLGRTRPTAGYRQNDNISEASSQRPASTSQQSDTPNRLGTTSPSNIGLSGRPDAGRTDSLMTSPTGLDAQSVLGFPDVGWTPSYQNLALVFSEIAKLPSDAAQPMPPVAVPFAGFSFAEGDELGNGGYIAATNRELPRTSPSAYALNGVPAGQPSSLVSQPSRLYSGSSTRSGTNSVSSARTGASSGMQIPLRNLAILNTNHEQMLLGNLNLNANSAASRVEDTLEEMEI